MAPLRVLVVEDEWPARNYLVELIESSGLAEVVGAVGGIEEAKQALRDEHDHVLGESRLRIWNLERLRELSLLHVHGPVPILLGQRIDRRTKLSRLPVPAPEGAKVAHDIVLRDCASGVLSATDR